MRRNFIIRKGFPLREKKARDFRLFHKEPQVFEEDLGITHVGDNHQQGSPHLFSPVGQQKSLGRTRKAGQSNTFPVPPWFGVEPRINGLGPFRC
jgi:hypothetical protein